MKFRENITQIRSLEKELRYEPKYVWIAVWRAGYFLLAHSLSMDSKARVTNPPAAPPAIFLCATQFESVPASLCAEIYAAESDHMRSRSDPNSKTVMKRDRGGRRKCFYLLHSSGRNKRASERANEVVKEILRSGS